MSEQEHGAPSENGNHKSCNLPRVPERPLETPIDPGREALIRYNEKKWVNHTVLHYHFLRNREEWLGSEKQKQAVRQAFDTWKQLEGKGIGLRFREVKDPSDAEIRIGFQRGGSWSYVGRDCIDLAPDPFKRTMNFGWDLTTPYGRDTALHEIGHALGFPHEHQNPNAGIVWDKEAVYRYFSGPPNYWDRDRITYNIIRKISPAEVAGSGWDKDSIMHYRFAEGLITAPPEYQNRPLVPEPGLSEVDIREALSFYPPGGEEVHPVLKPYTSHPVGIEPGDQLDFEIYPPRRREYTIQTFGGLDTVLVLFEDADGEPRYMAGDDDSGYSHSSKISARLVKGRKYYLRLRLYYTRESGQGAVMLW